MVDLTRVVKIGNGTVFLTEKRRKTERLQLMINIALVMIYFSRITDD